MPSTAPMLLIQGPTTNTARWSSSIASRRVPSAPTTRLVLDRCGHSPHRDQEAAVADAIVAFARQVRRDLRKANRPKGERL